MKLAEQIQLKKRGDFSCLCYLSKNLYNLANYYVRQEFFYLGNWLRYYDLWYILKDKEPYKKLSSQTAQQILILLDKNWKSFFNSMKEWKEHPEKYHGRPRPQNIRRKTVNLLLFSRINNVELKMVIYIFPEK